MARPRRRSTVETIFVPHAYMAFADRRTDDIVRRCCADPNIIESIARSCYLQGVWDGVQVAIAHPELLAELLAELKETS
jgi:hypothetical protein